MCPVVLFFEGVAIVTTVAVGPAVFSCLVLKIFCSFYFSYNLLLSSSVATICVHAILEVADDVGKGCDLVDDRVVGLCGIYNLGEFFLHGYSVL